MSRKKWMIRISQYWPLSQIAFTAVSIGATFYHLFAMSDEEFTHYHDEDKTLDTFTWADMLLASGLTIVWLGCIYNTSRHGAPENAVANHKFATNNSVRVMCRHANKLLVKAHVLQQLTSSDMSVVIQDTQALRVTLANIRLALDTRQVPLAFNLGFWLSFLRLSLSMMLGVISFVMTTFHENAELGSTEIGLGVSSLVIVMLYSLYLTRILNYLLDRGPTAILNMAFCVEEAQKTLMRIHAALLAALRPAEAYNVIETIKDTLSDKAYLNCFTSPRQRFEVLLKKLRDGDRSLQSEFTHFFYIAYDILKKCKQATLISATASHAMLEADRLEERLRWLSRESQRKRWRYILSLSAWCLAQGLMSTNAVLSIVRLYRPLEQTDWAIAATAVVITTTLVGKLNHVLWKTYDFNALAQIDEALVNVLKTCKPMTETVRNFDQKLKMELNLFSTHIYQLQHLHIPSEVLQQRRRNLRRTTGKTVLEMKEKVIEERTALLPNQVTQV